MLGINDFLPRFQLLNHRGKGSDLFRHAIGKMIVVILYKAGDPRAEAILGQVASAAAELDELAHVLAISNQRSEESAAQAERLGIPFPILFDDAGRAAAAFGQAEGQIAVFVADPNRRVLRIDRAVEGEDYFKQLAAFLAGRATGPGALIHLAAPVLHVPKALDAEHCRRLIELYDTGGNSPTGVFRDQNRPAGGLIDKTVKVRRDHVVIEPEIAKDLADVIGRRVVPEIFKAFSYEVKYVKEFKIGCYEAGDGGFFKPHRDNFAQVGGRRFAMSLHLNTGEYRGGELGFPEYGPDLYNPDVGGAVVFSCYHVHEVRPVTEGRRFVLLAFFYGAEGEARERPMRVA